MTIKLNYSGQEISEWSTLASHKDIISIDVSSTNITNLPEWIYGLKELEVLNLRATNIEYIDSRIGCLKKLRKLDISGTQIKKLPKELGQLDNILELYAYDIDLEDLDFDKKIPVNLIRLDISYLLNNSTISQRSTNGLYKPNERSHGSNLNCGFSYKIELLAIVRERIRSRHKSIELFG